MWKELGMAGHDVIVVGASAGGLEALREVVATLPPALPAAVCVVWHMAAESPGLLPEILDRTGPLPAAHPEDGELLQTGHIAVAPPDRHLLLEQGRLRLTQGPKENRFRPAIDPLFRSAAAAYGPRVIGVVLSGALDDGTAGMAAIKARGGLAVVQDPWDAIIPSMPRSVLTHVPVDHVVPTAEIGPLLADLARRPAGEEDGDTMSKELEIKGDGLLRFRCHTGHAYSVQSLLAEIGVSIEATLWGAVRSIEEQMLLLRHMADHLRSAGVPADAEQLLAHAREAEQQVQLVRLAVLRHEQRTKLPLPTRS